MRRRWASGLDKVPLIIPIEIPTSIVLRYFVLIHLKARSHVDLHMLIKNLL